MVINYKRLNDNTYDDAYKIPNKDSLINSIQGCKYFSHLDCKSGFWQIRLEEDSNAIWTKKNAPWIFQQMMDNIFGKYSFVIVYIDDILVFSYTLQEHIKHLEFVFEKLNSHGFMVNKKKLKLFKTQLELEDGQLKL